jgi:ribulose-phosphate 3-epimerase
LQLIRDSGLKAGVALNPSTPLESIKYVLDKLDNILVMTVNPGFGGQKFIPAMMLKIKAAREMVIENKKEIDIQIDGGVNLNNIIDIKNAGANILVVGSEIFKSDFPEDIINKIKNII